jgi:hypothetical protein
MMTGPDDQPAARRERLRADHADREQVIDTLKDAFVHGRLTEDELGVRAGQALIAQTYAELAALTADIPARPAMAGRTHPPTPVRDRPMARAAARSCLCLTIASAAFWVAGHLDDPFGPSPDKSWITPCLVVAIAAALAALFILGYGAGASIEQRRSRSQVARTELCG